MIAIIDYGMGNLKSVSKALEKVGGEVRITDKADLLDEAAAVVLPGVGAFSQAMDNLESLQMAIPIRRAVDEGKPFLGICLGLQLLFTESEEGSQPGLNLIPGRVRKFTVDDLKVPHMGWNEVRLKPDSQLSLFEGIPENSYFYFAHSYYVDPKDKEVILAKTDYGVNFTSAVRKGTLFGLQFHPEKSGEKGLKLLENFVRMVPS